MFLYLGGLRMLNLLEKRGWPPRFWPAPVVRRNEYCLGGLPAIGASSEILGNRRAAGADNDRRATLASANEVRLTFTHWKCRDGQRRNALWRISHAKCFDSEVGGRMLPSIVAPTNRHQPVGLHLWVWNQRPDQATADDCLGLVLHPPGRRQALNGVVRVFQAHGASLTSTRRRRRIGVLLVLALPLQPDCQATGRLRRTRRRTEAPADRRRSRVRARPAGLEPPHELQPSDADGFSSETSTAPFRRTANTRQASPEQPSRNRVALRATRSALVL